MTIRPALLVDTAVILALILVGVIGYKLAPVLLPKVDITVPPDAGCDLQRAACTAALPDGGRLRFALEPRPIPVAAPVTITALVDGIRPSRVRVDFAGVEMSMGYLRPELGAAEGNRYVGQTVLPVCVTGRMLWQATVLIDSGRGRIAVPFRFEAGH